MSLHTQHRESVLRVQRKVLHNFTKTTKSMLEIHLFVTFLKTYFLGKKGAHVLHASSFQFTLVVYLSYIKSGTVYS